MKQLKTIVLYLGTIAAVLLCCVVLSRAVFRSASSDLTVPSAVSADSTDYPTRLSIPRLHIDTQIQRVGITTTGKMAVPDNYTDVGWYKYGAVPGQVGAAVLAGHVDNGLALPGVFKHLDQLQEGDDVYVTVNSNQTLHFIVQGSKVYDKDAPTEEIFNEKDASVIRLITCTGTWLPDQHTHNDRLVVSAVLSK